MIYVVKPPTKPIRTTIELPASKSISNRVLIIRALSGLDFQIENLSDCDDTRVLQEGLAQMPHTIDVGAAGTSMRFLTAYLACQEGQEHVLTGSERMKQRPIRVLVDALRTLGADIEYMEEVGFPPLKIRGRKLHCEKKLVMDGSVSSQYISAVLMIGPLLEGGLQLQLDGEIASKPYIDMTLALMNLFGASATWEEIVPVIKIQPQPYAFTESVYSVEPDWSAAAFWLEIITLRGKAWGDMICLPGLSPGSLQGDAAAYQLFETLGSFFFGDYIKHGFSKMVETSQNCCFTDCPDLAQAMVVTSCLSDNPFIYTGLESLHIKETDRIAALKQELGKLGYTLHGGEMEGELGTLIWQRGTCRKAKNPVIETYKDHRMAMAFAPACIKTKEICIADPGVVTKSYPRFWDDLRKAGFTIEEVEK